MGLIILPVMLINFLHLPGQLPTIFLIVWSGVFALDFIDIMVHLKRDERETIHEAIAERNAMWFMVIALATGLAYQSAVSAATNSNQVDPVIIIALVGSLAIKAATHIYLRDK